MWLHEWLACVVALKGGEKGTGAGGEKRGGEAGESSSSFFLRLTPVPSPPPPPHFNGTMQTRFKALTDITWRSQV